MNLSFFKKPPTIFLFAIFILVIVWDIFLHINPLKTTVWNYLYNIGYAILYFVGAFMAMAGARKVTMKSSTGKAFLFLSLGLTSYGAGLIVWAYYNLILLVEIPYPSFAEILFLPCFIIFIGLGCLQLLSLFSTLVTKRHILEGIGIFVLSFLLVLGVISRPDISNDLSLLTKIANISYPVGDTILLTLAFLTFRVVGGKMQQSVYMLVVGLLVQVFADFLFTYKTGSGAYWNGDISDLMFTVSGMLLSLAIIALYYSFTGERETQHNG